MKSLSRAKTSAIVFGTMIAAISTLTPLNASALGGSFVDTVGGPVQIDWSPSLNIQYAGVNYVTAATSPCSGIPGQSADTMKVWASFAQAALLSGKTLRIYYQFCGTGGSSDPKYIGDVVLEK